MKPRDTAVRNRHYRCLEYEHVQEGELYLVACGIERADPGAVYGPDVRDCYHLHAVMSGTGVLHAGGQTFYPRAGQLFLLKDGESVQYTADRTSPWRYCWVTFQGRKARALAEEIGFAEGIYCLDSRVGIERFYQVVDRMFESPQMNRISEMRRHGLLMEYLALAMEAALPEGTDIPHELGTDVYMERAKLLIQKNYAQIQVADVARYVAFDRSYFSTAFKKHTGLSPMQYIIRLRMEKSTQFLTHTDWPVQEVARRVGYEDQLTFSRLFKKKYGVSPTQYRENLSAQEE